MPEKRISNQANAIIAFANAYRTTREPNYLHGIEEVDRFLQNWMMHEDGTFYTSQEDDPPGLSKNMSAIDYRLLDSDKKRRQFGVPPIDHAIYTDKNAQAIIAYTSAYEASGKSAYLDIAIRAAKALMASRLQDVGWILQTTKSDKGEQGQTHAPACYREKTISKRPGLVR